jgi:hypothetical protein
LSPLDDELDGVLDLDEELAELDGADDGDELGREVAGADDAGALAAGVEDAADPELWAAPDVVCGSFEAEMEAAS